VVEKSIEKTDKNQELPCLLIRIILDNKRIKAKGTFPINGIKKTNRLNIKANLYGCLILFLTQRLPALKKYITCTTPATCSIIKSLPFFI
jgi:hypothetical protein